MWQSRASPTPPLLASPLACTGKVRPKSALAALYALLFDFLNHRTGRLDPSYDAIAAKASCCRRSAVDAIRHLREPAAIAVGRLSRASAAPAARSVGTGRASADPRPDSAAVAEITSGHRMAAVVALGADPGDELALALAGLGRAMGAI